MPKVLVASTFLVICFSIVPGQSSSISFAEYGFAMARPYGWHQVEKRVLDDSVSQLELSSSRREKLKQDDEQARLLVLFTRYLPDTKRGINPKIEVRIVPTGSASPLSFEEFKNAYSSESRSYAAGRLSYAFIQEPTVVDIIGGRGVYQITRFTIRTNQRTEYTIRSRTLAIPSGTHYFLIGVVDELGGEDLSGLVDELVKSIKIGNHN